MTYTRPTARYDRETHTYEYLDQEGGAPPPSPSYSEGQASVKGVFLTVLIPHRLAETAEAKGVNLQNAAQAGALQGVKRARDADLAKLATDRTRNSSQAAQFRAELGLEIQALRKQRGLSRNQLWHVCLHYLDQRSDSLSRHHGWSATCVQQWEIGRSAPKDIEPIIAALNPDEDQAARWRKWWGACRRGAELPADASPVDDLTAVEKLARTLAEHRDDS